MKTTSICAIVGVLIGCIFFSMTSMAMSYPIQDKGIAVLPSTLSIIEVEAEKKNVKMQKDEKSEPASSLEIPQADQSKEAEMSQVKDVKNKGSCTICNTS